MKVLIVKPSSMGDVISALPALTDAKKVITNISFDWVVEENFSEIPGWHPNVERTIPIALRRWRKNPFSSKNLKEVKAFWKSLRSKQYDYVVDLHGLIKSGVVAGLAKGIKCGFRSDRAREPIAAFFYNQKFDVPVKIRAAERMRQLLAKALGYELVVGMPDYGVTLEKFKSEKTDSDYLVFVHGTSRDEKCWQVEKWIELAKLAGRNGFKVKLPWGNEVEHQRSNYIAANADNVEIIPRTNLTNIGKIILNSHGVVAVDTGFGHLAAALSFPAISLYGPTDPRLGGTYGKNQTQLTNMEQLSAEDVWEKMRIEFGL